ncbi:hypothetical protein [Leptospira kirschneri]
MPILREAFAEFLGSLCRSRSILKLKKIVIYNNLTGAKEPGPAKPDSSKL